MKIFNRFFIFQTSDFVMRTQINVQVNSEMQPIQSAEYQLFLSILILIHLLKRTFIIIDIKNNKKRILT